VGEGFAFIASGHRVLKVCKTTAWFKYGVGDGFAFIALGQRVLKVSKDRAVCGFWFVAGSERGKNTAKPVQNDRQPGVPERSGGAGLLPHLRRPVKQQRDAHQAH